MTTDYATLSPKEIEAAINATIVPEVIHSFILDQKKAGKTYDEVKEMAYDKVGFELTVEEETVLNWVLDDHSGFGIAYETEIMVKEGSEESKALARLEYKREKKSHAEFNRYMFVVIPDFMKPFIIEQKKSSVTAEDCLTYAKAHAESEVGREKGMIIDWINQNAEPFTIAYRYGFYIESDLVSFYEGEGADALDEWSQTLPFEYAEARNLNLHDMANAMNVYNMEEAGRPHTASAYSLLIENPTPDLWHSALNALYNIKEHVENQNYGI